MHDYPRILMDVDTQYDFMKPDGALYVPGSEEIVANIERLFAHAQAEKLPILSSADDHPEGDPEFEDFAPHCVVGTPGQRKLPETLLPTHVVIEEGDPAPDGFIRLLDRHGQIVFTKSVFSVWTNPHADAFVRTVSTNEYVAFGVATEYCVRADVLGLIERGQQVLLVMDAIRAVDADAGKLAIEEMIRSGARPVNTDDVVGGTA